MTACGCGVLLATTKTLWAGTTHGGYMSVRLSPQASLQDAFADKPKPKLVALPMRRG